MTHSSGKGGCWPSRGSGLVRVGPLAEGSDVLGRAHGGQRTQAVGVRRRHLVDPEDDGVLALLLEVLVLVRVHHGQIRDHARRDHALLVVPLEQLLVVVLIAVDLQRVHAQALGQRRHRANVTDFGHGRRGLGLPVDVRLGLDVLQQRVAAARVLQLAHQVHDDLGLEPRLLDAVVVGVHREQEALAADAVLERVQVLLAALFVGLLQGSDQRLARALVADLAEARRCLPCDLGVAVLDQLDQHVGVLRRRIARQHGGHQLAHRGALVAGVGRELVGVDQLDDLLGIEGHAPAEALHLRQVSGAVEHHDLARTSAASPSTTSAQAICGLAPGPALGRACISGPLALSAMGSPYSARQVAAIDWIGSLGRARALIARSTPAGSLAKASCFSDSATSSSLAFAGCPLAPLGQLLVFGQDEGRFLPVFDLLYSELLGVLLEADEEEQPEPDDGHEPDQNDEGVEASLLEVPVAHVVRAGRAAAGQLRVSAPAVRTAYGEVDALERHLPSEGWNGPRSGLRGRRDRFEHFSSDVVRSRRRRRRRSSPHIERPRPYPRTEAT